MGTIDLNAARAARSEAQKQNHELIFGETTYTLPPRVPLGGLIAATKGDMEAFLKELLDTEYEAFVAARPDDLDIQVLAEEIAELYGVDVGESPASGNSSKSTTKRSRPTSGGEAKTSVKSSGATRT